MRRSIRASGRNLHASVFWSASAQVAQCETALIAAEEIVHGQTDILQSTHWTMSIEN